MLALFLSFLRHLLLTTKEAIVLEKPLVRTRIAIPMFIFSRVPRACKEEAQRKSTCCLLAFLQLNVAGGGVCYKCSQGFSATNAKSERSRSHSGDANKVIGFYFTAQKHFQYETSY